MLTDFLTLGETGVRPYAEWRFTSCENVTLQNITAPNLKGKNKWGAPVRFVDCIGNLEVLGCDFTRTPDSRAYAGDGDEIWQINSSDVVAVDNSPEMMILTERPTETPGERGWVKPEDDG